MAFPRRNLGESNPAASEHHGLKGKRDNWEDALYELLMLLLDPAAMLPMRLDPGEEDSEGGCDEEY